MGERAQKFLSSPIYLFSALARIFVLFSCAKEMHDMQKASIDFNARRCERIRTPSPLRAQALGDLAIGIDASLSGEIRIRPRDRGGL